MLPYRQTFSSLDQALPWVLLVAGAVIFHLSLYSLSTSNPFPLSFLLTGIFLLALSVTSFVAQLFRVGPELTERQRNLQTIYLLGLSVSLSFTRLSRYAGFSGFDFVREASTLQNTLNTGYWDPSLGSLSNYQSSLAITILPTLTSGTIRVPGLTVFLFQTFFLIALLPLTIHPIINRLTGDFKLATFSSLLLSVNWFFYGQHIIGKTAPALFLAVLAFYCLVHEKKNFQTLGVLFSLGVAMSHYTISLFLAFTIVSYFAFSKILVPIFSHTSPFRQISPMRIGLAPIMASILLIMGWLAFAAPLIPPDAVSSIQQSVGTITQIFSSAKRVDTSLAISSSAGPAITAWFDFQNGLIGLGGLYLFERYRKGYLRGNLATWTLVGLSMIALLGAWILVPYLSVKVESTRILAIILPFIIVFLGVMLLRIAKPPSRLGLIAVMALILLMLPMNLMIADQQRNPLYHTADSLPLDKNLDDDSSLIPTYSNYAIAVWANSYLPSGKPVEVDAVGRYALTTALPFPSNLNFSQEQIPPYTFHRYSILSSYFVDNDVWSATILGLSVPIPEPPSYFFSPAHNVLYSSPKFWVMSPAP
ncbi:MAG TPA: hypothetical protein VNA15_09240 [Candidatus Angelobacter sp.]|nr:hypothetical protein [Candidatus Angelobacter sp.]